MKALIVGAGSIGLRHAANLSVLGGIELGAHDPDPARLAALGSAHPDAALLPEAEACWSWDPDVVFVTCPTHMHTAWALDAAARGLDLFIEKPLADRLDDLDGLESVASEKCLVTMVGCNMRFHFGPATVKRLLDEEAVGRVVSARLEVGQYLPDWHPGEDYRLGYSASPQMGGGVLLDAIHELDLAMWYFGQPSEVKAMHGHLSSLQVDTEDVADLLLRFADGPIASVHMDYVARAYARGCRVTGEEGTIVWDFTDGCVRLYRKATGSWEDLAEPAGYEAGRMYSDEVTYFMDRVNDRARAMNDVGEARRVLEVALTAKDGGRP